MFQNDITWTIYSQSDGKFVVTKESGGIEVVSTIFKKPDGHKTYFKQLEDMSTQSFQAGINGGSFQNNLLADIW